MPFIDGYAIEVARNAQVPAVLFGNILSIFVHTASECAEIEYKGQSYNLLDLYDVIDEEKVDDIGDEIAAQIYDNHAMIDFAGKTYQHLPDGILAIDTYIANAMWDAVIEKDVEDDGYFQAAVKAQEEVKWDIFIEIDDDFNVDVKFSSEVPF